MGGFHVAEMIDDTDNGRRPKKRNSLPSYPLQRAQAVPLSILPPAAAAAAAENETRWTRKRSPKRNLYTTPPEKTL